MTSTLLSCTGISSDGFEQITDVGMDRYSSSNHSLDLLLTSNLG